MERSAPQGGAALPAPVLLSVFPASPSRENRPLVRGRAERGTFVQIYADAGCLTAPLARGPAARFAQEGLQVQVADDSVTTFYAAAFDLAGRASPCSATGIRYVEDSTPPSAPRIAGTQPPPPANEQEPALLGLAEPGALVQIHAGPGCRGAPLATGRAAPDASFRIAVRVPANQTVALLAVATDAAGNASACSEPFEYVEDSTPPPPPDLITTVPLQPANDNAPTIVGIAEAGAEIRLYGDPRCDAEVARGRADASGTFRIAVGVADDSAIVLHARAIDAAGNASGCSPRGLGYVEDSTPPPMPRLLRTVPGSPARERRPRVFGEAEAGATVRLYAGADCAGPVLAQGAAGLLGSTGIPIEVPPNSATPVSALALDAAGNRSACASAALVYVEDSEPPPVPILSGTTPASPSRRVTTPTVHGVGEPGSVVRLYAAAGCGGRQAGVGIVGRRGTFAIPVEVPPNSETRFHATATDAAGNVSECGAAGITYVHDDTLPSGVTAFRAKAVGVDQILLDWQAATDNLTPPSALAYPICQSRLPPFLGGCSPFVATWTVSSGATRLGVSGLERDTRYWFVIRSRDLAGNVDGNPSIASARTMGEGAAVSVVVGGNHSCALLADGVVRCWGRNGFGELGDGSLRNSGAPLEVAGLGGTVVALAAGDAHGCAVLADGTARCWGANGFGQVGDGTTEDRAQPASVLGLQGALAVAAGYLHTCALSAGGRVRCWGFNGFGQLGDGTTVDRASPVAVEGVDGAVDLTAGALHSCALRADGAVRCWGHNGFGQLGDGTVLNRPTAVEVRGLPRVVAISAGGSHTCAVLAGGTVQCWGWNANGQLGDATAELRTRPIEVPGVSGAVSVSAGLAHTCVVRGDRGVQCWGYNEGGRLGAGTTSDPSPPVALSGLGPVSVVRAGGLHSCAIASGGAVRCWGHNGYGQLGTADTLDRPQPTPVASLHGVVGGIAIAASERHSCALLSDGSVQCWGRNDFGQLGDGTTISHAVPVRVQGLPPAVAVTTGQFHSCAVAFDGTARCWGRNDTGQLGDGSTTGRLTPVVVVGLAEVVTMAAGGLHTCAARVDGSAFCWGWNVHGQLGDGTVVDRSTAGPVLGLADVASLALGNAHACALGRDGRVWCWGQNAQGQVGDGTGEDRSSPALVGGLGGAAVSVSAGALHTCALGADGSVRCWGYNPFGQLGDGTFQDAPTPVLVGGLEGVRAIAAGGFHTCALQARGTVRCWGYNGFGQLGTGSLSSSPLPAEVARLGSAKEIGAGRNHTCALMSDGTARCWGQNNFGQLGDGTGVDREGPVPVAAFP